MVLLGMGVALVIRARNDSWLYVRSNLVSRFTMLSLEWGSIVRLHFYP